MVFFFTHIAIFLGNPTCLNHQGICQFQLYLILKYLLVNIAVHVQYYPNSDISLIIFIFSHSQSFSPPLIVVVYFGLADDLLTL